jgi:hypothetical protein
MFCVVETQGFALNGEFFMPKEITFMRQDKTFTHFHINKTLNFDTLNEKQKKIVEWGVRCFHGLAWDQKGVELSDCVSHLNAEGIKKMQIFTKGRDKARFLSNILGLKVHDIGVYGCPSINKISYKNACYAHAIVNARCSLVSAHFVCEYINGHADIIRGVDKNKQKTPLQV